MTVLLLLLFFFVGVLGGIAGGAYVHLKWGKMMQDSIDMHLQVLELEVKYRQGND